MTSAATAYQRAAGLENHMCNPISIIMSANSAWTPQSDVWVHSHEAIRKASSLPDGEWGDRYARVEVTPPGDMFRDPESHAILSVDESWMVRLDEERKPGWWADDEPAQIERARDIAAKWLRGCPSNLVPGHRAAGGDRSTLTGGDFSTLTGGDDSTLTGGDYSTLTGGDRSTLTGGDCSTLTWRVWDGTRYRLHTYCVGEGGIEAGVAYTWRNGKVEAC